MQGTTQPDQGKVRGPRGGYGGRRLTYREIGRRLGISHARVMQIERVALDKLRAALDALETER